MNYRDITVKLKGFIVMTKSEKPAKTTKAEAKKAASKNIAAKPAVTRKRAVKKPKFATADEMCLKLRKLINSDKAAVIKTNVAVDIEVWGLENDSNCHLYIEIKDGAVNVQPYEYNDCSLEAYISYDNMMKFLDGKLTIKDAIADGSLNANGNIPAAVMVASIF